MLCRRLSMSGVPWATFGEYLTPIGNSFHHDGKHIPFGVATGAVISVAKPRNRDNNSVCDIIRRRITNS